MRKNAFVKSEINAYLKECKESDKPARLLEICSRLGMTREEFVNFDKEDESLLKLKKKIYSQEEKFIVESTENGQMSSSLAMLRLKQEPFNYSEKRQESVVEEKDADKVVKVIIEVVD